MAIELTKKTMDGNEAAAYSSYAFTENAAIYREQRIRATRWLTVSSMVT